MYAKALTISILVAYLLVQIAVSDDASEQRLGEFSQEQLPNADNLLESERSRRYIG